MKPSNSPEARTDVSTNPLRENGNPRMRALVRRRVSGHSGRRLRELIARRARGAHSRD